MKTKQKKSYRSIISTKKYNALTDSEQYDFLIENKIYYKRNKKEIKNQHLEDIDKKQVWFL